MTSSAVASARPSRSAVRRSRFAVRVCLRRRVRLRLRCRRSPFRRRVRVRPPSVRRPPAAPSAFASVPAVDSLSFPPAYSVPASHDGSPPRPPSPSRPSPLLTSSSSSPALSVSASSRAPLRRSPTPSPTRSPGGRPSPSVRVRPAPRLGGGFTPTIAGVNHCGRRDPAGLGSCAQARDSGQAQAQTRVSLKHRLGSGSGTGRGQTQAAHPVAGESEPPLRVEEPPADRAYLNGCPVRGALLCGPDRSARLRRWRRISHRRTARPQRTATLQHLCRAPPCAPCGRRRSSPSGAKSPSVSALGRHARARGPESGRAPGTAEQGMRIRPRFGLRLADAREPPGPSTWECRAGAQSGGTTGRDRYDLARPARQQDRRSTSVLLPERDMHRREVPRS